jgi:uncharacterized cupredoxin-like copper-binding protein
VASELREEATMGVRRIARTVLVVGGVVTLVGCSSDTTTSTPGGSPAAPPEGTVNVTVQEFSVLPDPRSVAAGQVTFSVTNQGPDDVHEFVIVKTDLADDALPTKANGSVDEEGAGIEPVDEIEDMAVGSTETVTVDLEAGSYVLMCNIYDEEEHESHYQQGMHTPFTVT